MVVGCLRAFKYIWVVLVSLISIDGDDFGHLQDIENIIGTPHLRNVRVFIEKSINLIYELISLNSWILLNQIYRHIGKESHLATIHGEDGTFVKLLHL